MFSSSLKSSKNSACRLGGFATLKIRDNPEAFYRMPPEEQLHEGTWLQWPHNYGWDSNHIDRYEDTWVAMTKALHTGERVHLVVYNETEQQRVQHLLENVHHLDMTKIDFFIWPTNDVWVRDNGPIFVFPVDNNNNSNNNTDLCITNWLFNGWGGKAEYCYDNYIPLKVGFALGLPVIDVPMVHESGSVEVDGRGTMMAKRSSILNPNRNPKWTQNDAECFYRQYLGVTNFIWLEGIKGGTDITDDHIDGTARFANGDTIVTYYEEDFDNPKEYKLLRNAVDVNGKPYQIVHLPCTTRKLPGVGDYGIYINFYVANQVVLVPSYNDPNDSKAAKTLQRLYPSRKVVSIPSTELYRDGGMVHCVTQQQPAVTAKDKTLNV